MTDATGLKRWHATVNEVYERLCALPLDPDRPEGLSIDTMFALGLATGHISKAKALLGRDIDDCRPAPEPLMPPLHESGFR